MKDTERIIYNYKLILKLRTNLLMLLFLILINVFAAFIVWNKHYDIQWREFKTLLLALYFLYLFWAIWHLLIIKKGIRFTIPFPPWFGIMPKKMLTYQEYKHFELSYLFLSLFYLFIILVFIPVHIQLILLLFVFSLFSIRLYFFLRISRVKNKTIKIKYYYLGVSAYIVD